MTHRAWLVDLDGTLYFSLPVKVCMGVELVLLGGREIPRLRAFRREHERQRASGESFDNPFEAQIRAASRAVGVREEELRSVVEEWMFLRPGKWLRLFRRRGLIREIARHREQGGVVALVSDYPAGVKLAAMKLSSCFDVVVANGEDGGPSRLKPSSEGFEEAAQRLGVHPGDCLVIGDREDADGLAAVRAEMDFRLI